MKALIIDEPWIGAILKGDKTWEMRKRTCNIRGSIALIRKGSGRVVGIAEIVDSLPRLMTPSDYAQAESFHRIPPERQQRAFADGWCTPWVLANAKSLRRPVHYKHRNGAVIWVTLEPETAALVQSVV